MTSRACGKRLILGVLTTAMVAASVGPTDAETIVFTSGRTLSVRDYRISGDTITVTLRHGGEATFDRALVTRVAPDELPDPDEASAATEAPAAPRAVGDAALASRPFAELIEAAAVRHGVDPALVHAVVEAESNYEPRARSAVGARGLMQVMPSTARELGVASTRLLFDPQENVEAGVKYLKFLLERFNGNLTNAIAAYNAGPAAVTRYGGVPPFRETQAYVRKVLSRFQP